MGGSEGAKPLHAKAVPRPWGRRALNAGFRSFEQDEPIGEIWHPPLEGDDAPLLIKHLFTAERLSIQVHPDDEAAHRRGLLRGKDEAWLILDAHSDARIGLGLVRSVGKEELREAALSGAIEQLIDWRPARKGDFFYSPAGTIHAIGAGLSLVEIQQNLDVTYRLYDYRRPRQLHIEDGIAVATRKPWLPQRPPQLRNRGRTILSSDQRFVVETWRVDQPVGVSTAGRNVLLVHVAGTGSIDGTRLAEGAVWSLNGTALLEPIGKLEILLAYEGASVIEGLARDP